MLGGGSVDGAIHRAAGPELRAACWDVPEVRPSVRCPTGEARITPGFRLPVSHVIHTVGPIYHPDDHPEVSLQSAYRNCLKLAKENNIQYIAFPALSCGVYSYPFKDASIIAISTVKEFAGDFKEGMSQNQGNENDYMEEDHEMANVYDDVDEEFQGRGMGGMESDDDEYDHMDNKITDTSSAQARGGKDIQGIPWERLNVTKEKYRQTRLEQYKNYESVPQSGGESEKECKPTKKGGMYYDFRLNTRSVKSTILHFQASQAWM